MQPLSSQCYHLGGEKKGAVIRVVTVAVVADNFVIVIVAVIVVVVILVAVADAVVIAVLLLGHVSLTFVHNTTC